MVRSVKSYIFNIYAKKQYIFDPCVTLGFVGYFKLPGSCGCDISLKQEMQTGMLWGATTNATSSNITLNIFTDTYVTRFVFVQTKFEREKLEISINTTR